MELEVKEMTCGYCARVITKAVKEVDAQAKVDIDVRTKTVRIDSPRGVNDFMSIIREVGYSPTVRA
jgi:copper chaperone